MRVCRKHVCMRAHIEQNFPVFRFVSVAGMEHIGRLDVAPDRVLTSAFSWQQSDAGLVLGVPAIGKIVPRKQCLHREGHGQVEDDDVVLRDHAVVNRWAIRDSDWLFATDLTRAVDDYVADSVLVSRFITNGMHLTSLWIEMGVG